MTIALEQPSPARNAARQSIPALGAALVVIALSIDACVIADPPSDLPRVPATRPTIVRASVVPSVSAVLGRWPDRFIVPVELSDPGSTIFWSSFIDFNPGTGFGLIDTIKSDFEPSTTTGRVRLLEVGIPKPAALDQCHVIEVVVALGRSLDSKSAHTPDEPGGDIVTWFFNPSGDLAGCPALDAGLPPPPPPDAGDGGEQ